MKIIDILGYCEASQQIMVLFINSPSKNQVEGDAKTLINVLRTELLHNVVGNIYTSGEKGLIIVIENEG